MSWETVLPIERHEQLLSFLHSNSYDSRMSEELGLAFWRRWLKHSVHQKPQSPYDHIDEDDSDEGNLLGNKNAERFLIPHAQSNNAGKKYVHLFLYFAAIVILSVSFFFLGQHSGKYNRCYRLKSDEIWGDGKISIMA